MAPLRSSSRTRRWHGEMLSPTRSASSVTVSRPSSWSRARIFRLTASIGTLLPPNGSIRGKLGSTFGLIRASFLSEAESEGENAMAASSVAAFWVVAFLLIIVPGADWAFVIGTVLGGRPVLPAVGGLVLGYAGIPLAVAAGVGALVARAPAALTALTVAGGLYLIWLGARALARPGGHRLPG